MQQWRVHTLFFCIIAMMAALFFSRAMLSVAMMLFVAVSFLNKEPLGQLRRFVSSPLLWGMSLLFFLPLISGLWSVDKTQWLDTVRIKLPLLFLPFAFASPFSFTQRMWNALTSTFILLVLGGTLWSFFHYAGNAAAINEGYLSAKSMITPLGNDHVRFSWLVSVAVLFCGWLYFRGGLGVWEKYFVLAAAVWLIIFLHLLAARTGLLSFYIGMFITVSWMIQTRLSRLYGLFLLFVCLALPLVAYYTVPTFQNKVKYFRYELEHITGSGYLPGSNDGVRLISMKAGWNIMKENPVSGVGFGDVMPASRNWYASRYPQMPESDKIFPSSEWLMYGAGCGIPGFIIFTVVMCLPFFTRTKYRLSWLILNATAAFSFMADIGLEVQYGVFAYSFIVLWWWKRSGTEKA
jgi:O-antigen ligase